MFGKKKPSGAQGKERRDLSQYGLFDIPDDLGAGDVDTLAFSGDESDLEAELAAITGGGAKKKQKTRGKAPVPMENLDAMVAESLKDVDTDVDSEDENDPNLLSELGEITGEEIPAASAIPEPQQEIFLPTSTEMNVQEIIKQRLEMYTIAERNAKEAGDSGKARRFARGLKTLKELQKAASSGKNIPMEDIPPEVSIKPVKSAEEATGNPESPSAAPSTPSRAAPAPPVSPPAATEAPKVPQQANSSALAALNGRKNEYKAAALAAKKSGDTASALKYVRILKQFDMVIKAVEEGQEVDLAEMPPHPSELDLSTLDAPGAVAAPPPEPPKQEAETQKEPDAAPAEEGLIVAGTVEEALQQRLDKYKSVEKAAKDEGNSSKARRFGRIVKQYEDALKMHKAGKPVPFDELPTPPGFGPIPVNTEAPAAEPVKPAAAAKSPPEEKEAAAKPAPPPRPKLKKQESTRISGNLLNTSVMDKQVAELERRQKEFKDAAIQAKRAGEIEQAKEYLKIFKGFDKLLETARGGLPVDMATLPIPPGKRAALEDSFAFVTESDCQDSELGDLFKRLEEQLQHQLSMCRVTREHHKNMGDVAGTNRFENLALTVQKDLDVIRLAHRRQLELPKFHYEQRSFNIVMCNTDLTDNEVEITVVRGINYNVPNPKDVDTYVKLEFPYPQDEHTKSKTQLVKNTDNPEYDYKTTVEIVRSNKQCQRMFKRHSLKLEVYADRGFFRSDQLLGTVNIKLQPLETSCEIHDSFELMDGRKKAGGKLEVHIRIRNPILTKEVKKIDEKWLVIDA
ncbi:coiled-coil and C2 domain-containing protein 1-like isoform X2 [Lutzomyia longipalpis]|uniref:coiled-coil and C2 domain-containing protein 1-like isoform X2 n=1 Tax=Lutzomyia longipalpis TaxID=7200 RepID=UPI002483CB38|nr:coiled-coil and C2 domain-containing protein 1-like isoform X2 [Lutzomyia longipalpis]